MSDEDLNVLEVRLAEELRLLDQHPKGVAAKLLEEGITGRPGMTNACPVARWLNKQMPGLGGFHVGITLAQAKPYAGRKEIRADLPERVSQFVWDFDGGRYPALFETREPR